MPRKASAYRASGVPGIGVNAAGTSFCVRWQQAGKEKTRSFPTLDEALAFRRARGIGRSSPLNSVKGAASLANLRAAPLQTGTAHRVIHNGKGAISEAELAAKEQEVYDAIAEGLPVRSSDGDPPRADRIVVAQLAESLLRRARVTEYEREHGLLSDNGKVRPATELGLELDSRILALCRELAMTPRSRATLGLEVTIGSAVAHTIGLLDGRNPVDIDSRARRAAARALLGMDATSDSDAVDGAAIESHDTKETRR